MRDDDDFDLDPDDDLQELHDREVISSFLFGLALGILTGGLAVGVITWIL